MWFNDISNENNFEWFDGTNVIYSNWDIAGGQPNEWNNQDCVFFDPNANGKWSDITCDHTLNYFVCNLPEKTATLTTVPTSARAGNPTVSPTNAPTDSINIIINESFIGLYSFNSIILHSTMQNMNLADILNI